MTRLAFSTWVFVATVCAACTGDSFEDVPPTDAGAGGGGQGGAGSGGGAPGGISGSSGQTGQAGQAGQVSGAGGEAGGAAGGEGGQAGEAGQGGGPDAGSGGMAGTSGQGGAAGATAGQGGSGGVTAAGQGGAAGGEAGAAGGGAAGQGGAGGVVAGQGGAAGSNAAGAAGGPGCTKETIELEEDADTVISSDVKLTCGLVEGGASSGCVTVGPSRRALLRFKVPEIVATQLQGSPGDVTLTLLLHFPFSCGSTNSKGLFQGQVFPLRTDWEDKSATWCNRQFSAGDTDFLWSELGASGPGVDIGSQAANFKASVGDTRDIALTSASFSGGNWVSNGKLAVRLSFDAQTIVYLGMHENPQETSRPRLTVTHCKE